MYFCSIILTRTQHSGMHFGWPARMTACTSWVSDAYPLVLICLVPLVCMPPTTSDHLKLRLPTLQCHSNAHCVSSHTHATPVTGLNSDQCLISLDLVPMSRATAYLSFSPYAAFA